MAITYYSGLTVVLGEPETFEVTTPPFPTI